MSDGPRNRAYLSLGSNIEPEVNLPAAVRELAQFGRVVAVSKVWESAPFGESAAARSPAAKNFLNGAVLLETELSVEAICGEAVPAIEQRLGRVRDPHDKNAPRTIDVDVSLFNDDRLTVGHRTIPDPDIVKRAFVAMPLAEIAPDYVLPTNKRTLAEIAAELAAKMELWLRADVSLR
jgi:2-amino-4-hydroxy-6-hydroxymethyldihydropteridine diphosphokinase